MSRLKDLWEKIKQMNPKDIASAILRLYQKIFRKSSNSMDKWKTFSKKWWMERKEQRQAERKIAIAEGKRLDIEQPLPFLECWREDGPHGSVGSQFRDNFKFNQWNEFYVVIGNKGFAPSWNCIVEVFQNGAMDFDVAYKLFILNDRKIITLMPGESREVKLKFRPTRKKFGGLTIRSYDPLFDPGPLVKKKRDRHNEGFGWETWQ